MGKQKQIIALDTETTGVITNEDKIVQIYLAEITPSGQIVRDFKSVINPLCPIPKDAMEVHGITDEMVKNSPTFKQLIPEITSFTYPSNERIFLGHNVKFDVDILHYEMRRNFIPYQDAIPFPYEYICTLEEFREDVPHNLEGAANHYLGLEMVDAHDAEYDTKIAIKVAIAQSKHKDLTEMERRHTTLDRQGRFIATEEGEIVFTFGKHKGLPIRNHLGYLHWMLNAQFAEDTKEIARKVLGIMGRR